MNRASGEILEAALIEPVSLTKHGTEKLIIVPASQYHRLVGRPQPTAYTLADAPEDVHDELMAALDEIIADGDEHV